MEKRTCRRCGERNVTTRTGVPVCSECRTAPRRQECNQCGTVFFEAHKRTLCIPCRGQAIKVPCPHCGTPIKPTSLVCQPCWGRLHSGENHPLWTGHDRRACIDCGSPRSLYSERCWECYSKPTHCKYGHLFDDENTYVTPEGERACKECRLRGECSDCGKRIARAGRCVGCANRFYRGENHPAWRGGRSRHDGYVLVRTTDHPRRWRDKIYEHILIAEQNLGRYLRRGEVVHHRNRHRDDNRPDNLWVFPSQAQHRIYHALEDKHMKGYRP